MSSEVVLWIVDAILLLIAGFLAMAETSLTRMNRVKAITVAEE